MARRILDQVLIVDIESTCWEKEPPPKQQSEIIEIGVSAVDMKTFSCGEAASIIIKPQHSTVSEFCTRLTTLTQEHVDQGTTYAAACGILNRNYKSDSRVWASYGDYDRNMFQKMSKLFNVRYPFSSGHINVKTLFALTYGLDKEIGMARALDMLGLPLIGTHHRGVDDARNIALIFGLIMKRLRVPTH